MPPICLSGGEWAIMRDSNIEPVAIIRKLALGACSDTFYRIVTWAPASEDRQLVGYSRP